MHAQRRGTPVVDDSPDIRDQDGPPPPGVDISVAHPARVRNFWLGGRDYFKADRLAGAEIAEQFPHLPQMARAERAFLVRAIRFLAGPARMKQFLDLGSGLPAGGNTHEIAQRIAADTGIVYVDNDPVVLAHAKSLLDSGTVTGNGPVCFVDADLRDVRAVLSGAESTLDLHRPVALFMLGILGHLDDYGAARSVTSQLLAALPSGSYLAIADGVNTNEDINRAQSRFNARGDAPYYLRRPDEIASFFDGLDLIEPGIVPCGEWKPDRIAANGQGGQNGQNGQQDDAPVYCGVARKP
jgi:hypothetical protein